MDGLFPMEWRRELVIGRTDREISQKKKTVDAERRDRERPKKRAVSERIGFEGSEPTELRHVIDLTL